MSCDVPAFLDRFFAFGAEPSVDRYLALFHPEATLFDSGMPEPIPVAAIPEHFRTILAVIPDLQMVPERWREDDDTVFVEARNTATVGNTPMEWRSIYCVDLDGGHVIRGRRYYDRRGLFARLDPHLPAFPATTPLSAPTPPGPIPAITGRALVDAIGELWKRGRPSELPLSFREDAAAWFPAQPAPLGREALASYAESFLGRFERFDFTPLRSAGDENLGFLEWEARAQIGTLSFALRGSDRFDLAPGGVLASRRYFDTLELANLWAEHLEPTS
ncbi:MAG: nuclear transport factor 2 family protein [Myxococcota bacterium]